MRVLISEAPIAIEAELERFARGHAEAGALASFVGYCRAVSHGRPVARLELEHYPGFSEARIGEIAEAIMSRHALIDVLAIHRVGAIAPGEAIVLVAALTAHRKAAFAAVEALMDHLKTDAPIWKKEIGPDGARWVEPTQADRAARAALDKETCA